MVKRESTDYPFKVKGEESSGKRERERREGKERKRECSTRQPSHAGACADPGPSPPPPPPPLPRLPPFLLPSSSGDWGPISPFVRPTKSLSSSSSFHFFYGVGLKDEEGGKNRLSRAADTSSTHSTYSFSSSLVRRTAAAAGNSGLNSATLLSSPSSSSSVLFKLSIVVGL